MTWVKPEKVTLRCYLDYAGRSASLRELARKLSMNFSTMWNHLDREGWKEEVEEALGTVAPGLGNGSETMYISENGGEPREFYPTTTATTYPNFPRGKPKPYPLQEEEEYAEAYEPMAPSPLGVDDLLYDRDYYEDVIKTHELENRRLTTELRKLRGKLYDREATARELGAVIKGAVGRHRAKNPECVKYIARSKTREDWVCLAPVSDLHSGAQVWGSEKWGANFDTQEACRRLEEHGRQIAAWIRSQGGTCLNAYAPDLGDILHGPEGRTTHGTILHQDTRAKKVLDMTLDARLAQLEEIRKACEKLYVHKVEGNHEGPWSHSLHRSVYEHYRDSDDVVVEHSAAAKTYFTEGEVLYFLDHGYGINRLSTPGAIAKMRLTAEHVVPSDTLGAVKRVVYILGHLHHEERKEEGKFDFRRLPAMCEPDEFAERIRVASKPGAVAFRLGQDGYIQDTHNLYC